MYNSSGPTLSLTKNKFIKIVPARKERKERKKKEKWKDFRSWNAPVFCKVNEWLQHWGRSPEGGQRNLDSQSSKFPLKHKEESEGGVRTLGAREIMSVGVWLWNWNSKASICLQNLCFSSTKFSFQSPDRFKMKMGVCCVVLCYRDMDSNRNTSAWCTWFLFCSLYTAICSLLAALRITRRSDCLIQGQNFEVKKKKKKMCLLVSGIVINSCLSACRRSTQRPGNSFVLLFLLLH